MQREGVIGESKGMWSAMRERARERERNTRISWVWNVKKLQNWRDMVWECHQKRREEGFFFFAAWCVSVWQWIYLQKYFFLIQQDANKSWGGLSTHQPRRGRSWTSCIFILFTFLTPIFRYVTLFCLFSPTALITVNPSSGSGRQTACKIVMDI